jgi:hypothetical protein
LQDERRRTGRTSVRPDAGTVANARTAPAAPRIVEAIMRRSALYAFSLAACVMLLSPAAARSPVDLSVAAQALDHLRFAQGGQCWRRIGPFVTQDTAWARWRQARDGGLSVSNGVVPCWDSGSRGYCFNVFYAC